MHLLFRFLRCTKGTSLIEFAFAFPVLLFCAFVLFEFVSFQLVRIRVDKSAFMLANAITQMDVKTVKTGTTSYGQINDDDLTTLLERFDEMVPQASRGGAKVIVSAFSYVDHYYDQFGTKQPVNAPIMLWARGMQFGQNNPPGSASTIEVLGNNDHWGKGIKMEKVKFIDANTKRALKAPYSDFECVGQPEHLILVEVFYDYVPVFSPLFANVHEPPLINFNFIKRHTVVSRAFLRPRGADIEALEDNASFATPDSRYLGSKSRVNGFCNP
jgi:hypothetical protein